MILETANDNGVAYVEEVEKYTTDVEKKSVVAPETAIVDLYYLLSYSNFKFDSELTDREAVRLRLDIVIVMAVEEVVAENAGVGRTAVAGE